MPKVKVYNKDGQEVGSQELSDKVFGVKPKVEMIHQVVTAMMANKRQVLAHTKDRGEVRGGGRKPWRQKGTGRARHGSIRSPLWVGGGVTFGPTRERSFKKKINDKMRRKAIFMCLTDRVKDDRLILLDEIKLDKPKTKEMVGLIDKLRNVFYKDGDKEIKKYRNKEIKGDANLPFDSTQGRRMHTNDTNEIEKKVKIKPKKILMLIAGKNEKIQRACRNLKFLKCILASNVNLLDILAHEFLLTSIEGIKSVERTFIKK